MGRPITRANRTFLSTTKSIRVCVSQTLPGLQSLFQQLPILRHFRPPPPCWSFHIFSLRRQTRSGEKTFGVAPESNNAYTSVPCGYTIATARNFSSSVPSLLTFWMIYFRNAHFEIFFSRSLGERFSRVNGLSVPMLP